MGVCLMCNSNMPEPVAINPVIKDVCEECTGSVEVRMVTDICEYLEILPAPILVVDGQHLVRGANSEARRTVSGDFAPIAKLRGGDVFECVHARLPEGCGRTVHCSGCTIRRAIQDTLSTGKPMCDTPVDVVQRVEGQDRRVEFRVSTQRLANCVLLKLEGGL